jgi:hypothetical protein
VCRNRCLNDRHCTAWSYSDSAGTGRLNGLCSLGSGATYRGSEIRSRHPPGIGTTSGEVLELWKLQASR